MTKSYENNFSMVLYFLMVKDVFKLIIEYIWIVYNTNKFLK